VSTTAAAFSIEPSTAGRCLIVSSSKLVTDGTALIHIIVARMIGRALEYMPLLGDLSSTRVWTGHRAATPDKLPLIGPSLSNDRIWLATGHEGLGITTSLGTARILANLLLDRPTEIPAAPYAPARFANTATR